MSTAQPERQELANYADPEKAPPVFRLRGKPTFSPIDVNVAFLARSGWNQSNDRLRFQPAGESDEPAHPLMAAIRSAGPFLLIRRFDREAGRLACVRIAVTGEFEALSNDRAYARSFVAGWFLECPPPFHTSDEWETEEAWVDEAPVKGMFAGLVAGAMGWDPEHGIPQNIRESLVIDLTTEAATGGGAIGAKAMP